MPLALHDVEDAERVVRSIVRRSGFRLSYHDRQDLEQRLLEQMWELSLRYDPSRGIGFGAWATTTLRKRIVDHQRSQFRTVWKFRGNTYTRERPTFLDLDRLADTLAAVDGDPSTDWHAALGRLRRDRDRCRARDLEVLGIEDAA